MTRTRALLLAALLTAGTNAVGPATAQTQEFRTTPAKEVRANPQRFWARGVVFRDVLAEPIGEKGARRIAGRKAYPFTTKVVGVCHADESILPALRELPPGQEYIFTATVYSDRIGFIRRQTKYFILVTGVMAPVGKLGELADDVEAALANAGTTNVFTPPMLVLRELMVRIQAALTAEAETAGYPRSELFDPESEHFEKLEQIIRRAVGELETETKVPAREQFIETIRALLAMKEGVFATPDEPVDSRPALEPETDAGGGDAAEAAPTESEAREPDPAPSLRLTVRPGRQVEPPAEPAPAEPEIAGAQPGADTLPVEQEAAQGDAPDAARANESPAQTDAPVEPAAE